MSHRFSSSQYKTKLFNSELKKKYTNTHHCYFPDKEFIFYSGWDLALVGKCVSDVVANSNKIGLFKIKIFHHLLPLFSFLNKNVWF